MTLQEQLRAFQQKRNEIAERQQAIMTKAGDEGRTLDDEESSEYDGLTAESEHVEKHIGRLTVLVRDEGAKAKTEVKGSGPTILVRNQDKDDEFQGQSFTRAVIAKALAKMSGYEFRASDIAKERWGKSHPNLVRYIATKGAVEAGGTTGATWGHELAQADSRYTGDFIEYLKSKTVYDRLPLREVPANVTIKGQDGIATADWVGEHDAIPVSAQDYSTVTLGFKKVGAISVVSKELLRHSSPAAEALVRDALVESSGQKIDQTFLGTGAASVSAPAGMLASPLTSLGSNGWTAEALRQDIKELYAPFLAAKNATGLYVVTTPTLAKSISLMVNALGQTEFPGITAMGGTLLGDPVVTGDNVGATHIILLKPSDIYKIGDTGVEVSLSMDATLEQSDSPAGFGGSPVTGATQQIMSMFQTEQVAFKVVRAVNFAKRRTHAVQFISDAQYGNPNSTTA